MKHLLKRIRILCLEHAYKVLGVVMVFSLLQCANGSNGKLIGETDIQYEATEFPNTESGRNLKAHMRTMTAYGEDAEANYQASLTELRKDSTMHETVYQTYKNFSEDRYMARILLVETLKELRTTDALNALNAIATSKIPEERSEDLEYSTMENEIIIRVTAVEGLIFLANMQSEEAKSSLLNLTSNEDLTIKQMAIRGYLSSLKSPEELKRRIAFFQKQLPQDQHWMISAQATEITTVPHPEMPEDFKLAPGKGKNDTPQLNN